MDAQAKATSGTTELSNNVSKGKVIDSAETVDNSLKNVEKYTDHMKVPDDQKALENNALDLRDAVDPVMEATPDTLGAALDTARPKMATLSENVSDLQTSVSEKVDTDGKADIKTFQDDMTTMNDDLKQEDETAKEEADDPANGDPDTDTIDFPPEEDFTTTSPINAIIAVILIKQNLSQHFLFQKPNHLLVKTNVMADQTKLCSLTNNSGKDVVVALTISDDETASPDAVISANQQLEILRTSAGQYGYKKREF